LFFIFNLVFPFLAVYIARRNAVEGTSLRVNLDLGGHVRGGERFFQRVFRRRLLHVVV